MLVNEKLHEGDTSGESILSGFGSSCGSSTDEASDQEEFIAELTRQMAENMLQEDDENLKTSHLANTNKPKPSHLHINHLVQSNKQDKRYRHQNQQQRFLSSTLHNGSGMKVVFLGETGSKNGSSGGTGVFIPYATNNLPDHQPRKKPGAHISPHIESSDYEETSSDSDDESSDSDEESDDSVNNNIDSDSSCHVMPDGQKLWTPKCDDKQKPQLNQYFTTKNEAFLFYVEYGRTCGFDVRKSTEKTRRGKLLAKYVQCSHAGSPFKKKNMESEDLDVIPKKRRKTTSKRCGCKAQIILKPAGLRGLVIMGFIEEHNHPLASEAGKMFLRCNRGVSIPYQNFIMDCSRANIGPTRAYSLVKEMVGSYEDVGATACDFKNFSRDVKSRIGVHDAHMILEKFKLKKHTSNNIFFYDHKVDKNGHLTGLFWTDAIGQANYDVFGDIISFDPTFRTNRYNMVFIPFTGVDNHWKNVTFAGALLAKENYKNFKWLLRSFKTAMGHVPSCVITDQCPAIKKAVRKHWKHAKHRLCMWHIMNKLPGKIGPVLASNKKFMEQMKSFVWADHLTPQEFEEGWKTVISEYNLEGNVWLNDMYSIRKQWIPAYFSDIEMAGLLRTTSRSESSNFFFQHFHESGETLVEFYSSFESAMDKQRVQNREDDKKSENTPKLETSMKIEIDASKVYTRELYYLVRDEIKSACYHTRMEDMSTDTQSRYFKCRDDLLGGKIFEVQVRMCDYDVKCNCNFYFRRGYLCRHAFAALQQCGVHKIPSKFVKSRWTKDAIKHHSVLGSQQVPQYCDKRDRTKLKRTKAWFEFNNCMNFASDDEDKVDSILTGVHAISSRLRNAQDNSDVHGSAQRVDKFVGPVISSEISVQNPNISRNKGCGSRIKSSREISIDDAKGRKCSRCGKMAGHNARTCPLNKQSQ